MAGYSTIAIIYNPKATGHGQQLGEALIARLSDCLPGQAFELLATKRPGHAEELAYQLAKKYRRPLVISASGDGGYHEVVNGLMRATHEGATPIAGVLPAGNANDHYRNVHRDDLVASICATRERHIDVLKLSGTSSGKPYTRYAHSYIGLGLTAKVSAGLQAVKGKRLKESGVVLRAIMFAKPVTVVIQNQTVHAHSIIFSNIPAMAKYFKVAGSARPDDGRFELSIFASRSKLLLALAVLKRMTFGRRRNKQVARFTCRTTAPTLVQLDGEIVTLDADSAVSVVVKPVALSCVV